MPSDVLKTIDPRCQGQAGRAKGAIASTSNKSAAQLSAVEAVDNSPYIEALIARHKDDDHRPLMRIGDMQAWAVKDESGKPVIALTTNDGLTIIGSIIGPQGEDISAALLATVPDPDRVGVSNQVESAGEDQSLNLPQTKAPMSVAPPRSEANMSPLLSNVLKPPQQTLATPLQPGGQQTNKPDAAPITASQAPTAEQQAGMDLILKQATDERVWFSAGTPKDGAPVVYMLADPECPHCQWTTDKMQNQIQSGDIDLRIIFAPITGVQGFNTSLSILHTDDIPRTFMSHMTSTTRGTAAVAQMDTAGADRNVIQGIVNNIDWMRANRMPGVPFFLYNTEDGARFAFSELPSNILTEAKPL